VVGVAVRVERGGEAQAELAQERRVPQVLLEDGVDEDRLARRLVGEQVAVRVRGRVEELAKEQGCLEVRSDAGPRGEAGARMQSRPSHVNARSNPPAGTDIDVRTMTARPSRRSILAGAAGLATGAIAARLALPSLQRSFARPLHLLASSFDVVVDRPADLETPLGALGLPFTPNQLFFVRSHHGPPPEGAAYALTVDGLGRDRLSLSLDELRSFPKTTLPAVLQCAGNGRAFFDPPVPGAQWRRGAAGQAKWAGARLADVLARAGVDPRAKQVRLEGADRPANPSTPAFVRSIPIERALDPTTLLAYEMNDAPLPRLHGAPVRLVVPGWVGDDWVKWLTHVTLAAEEDPGFYMAKGYRVPDPPVAPGEPVKNPRAMTVMPVKSIVAVPADGAQLPKGRHPVVGVAWSGAAAIARVEVSTDGGETFRDAVLDGPSAPGAWRVWTSELVAKEPGELTVIVRATDASGATQPERTPWNPGGYLWNSIERVRVTVAA
jgi:sulfite oxidase